MASNQGEPYKAKKIEEQRQSQAEKIRQLQEELANKKSEYREDISDNITEAVREADKKETTLIEDNLDKVLNGEDVEGLVYKMGDPSSQPFVEKVIRIALKSKDKDKNLEKILSLINDKKMLVGAFGLESRKMLIEHFQDKPEQLKTLFRKMFETAISGRILIEAIGDNKANLEVLIKVIETDTENLMVPIFKELQTNSLVSFINNLGLEKIEKLLTKDQKAQLLETSINQTNKKKIFTEIKKELEKDLKAINKYQINAIISILQYTQDIDETKFRSKIIQNINNDNKELIKKELERRNSKQLDGQPVEEDKAKEEKVAETFDVEIGKKHIKFSINEVERSFLANKTIKKELENLKTPAEKKLYCYKRLLNIIDRNGSMHETLNGKPNPDFNKHNVADGNNEKFKASNIKLQSEIARLEGQTKEQKQEKAEEEAVAEGEGAQNKATTVAEPSPAPSETQAPAPAEDKTLDEQVTNIDSAIAELKTLGVEITQPSTVEKMTNRELKELKELTSEIKSVIENGTDVIWTISALKQLDKQLKKALKNSPIKELTFKFVRKLKWEKSKALGFGNEQDLIDPILDIKEAQFKKDPDSYTQYFEKSKTRFFDYQQEAKLSLNQEKYIKEYEKFTNDNFDVDDRIGELSEEEMIEQWPNLDGYKKVEIILTSPPFLQTRENAPVKTAAIISEYSNKSVTFDHIFKAPNLFEGLNKSILPEKFVKTASAFKKEFERLRSNESKLNKDEKERYNYMIHYVYLPCTILLQAIRDLRMKEKSTQANEEEAQSENNAQIQNKLGELFNYTEREDGFYEKFIVAMSKDGEKTLTLNDMDGKKFTVDQGRLRRKYNPRAALNIFNKQKGLYKIENDQVEYQDTAITKEVNRLMQLGLINNNLANKENKNFDSVKVTSIKSTNFTSEQMELFQIGFMIDQASKFSEQIQEGKEALTEQYPAIEKILDDLIKQGVSENAIPQIRKQLLLVAGAHFHNGSFNAAFLGVPIPINDTISISIGLAATKQGKMIAGVYTSVKVYEHGRFKVEAGVGIDMQGASVGSSQSMEVGMVKLDAFEGFRWSWASVLPTFGGGLVLSWNTQKQLEKDINKKESASQFKEAFDEFKKISKTDVKARYEKLTTIPKIWESLGPIQDTYRLKDADIVHIVENIQEELTNQAVEKLGASPIPLIASIGIGMVGGVPMPIVGIKLGSAKISVPQRREIAKMLSTFSNARVEKDIKEALEKFDNGTATIEIYREKTGEIVYSKDGLLMIKDEENSGEVDLSKWNTDTLGQINETLDKNGLEIKLVQLPDNKIELKILNDKNQDTEIYPDPLMQNLCVAKDGKRLIIEGNIKDLIITRERFTIPFKGPANVSNIRDIITIRQSTSVAGDRNREWLETKSRIFFQKLENESEYFLYKNRDAVIKQNIFESYNEDAKAFKKHRPNLEGRIGKQKVAKYENLIKERNEALKSYKTKEYDKQEIRPNFFDNLNTFYDKMMATEKDTIGQYSRFARIVNDPKKIVEFIQKHNKKNDKLNNLNDREANFAVMHILNRWFTNIYSKEKTSKKTNDKLKKAVNARINYFKKDVFPPEIKKAISAINSRVREGQLGHINSSAEELSNKLVDGIYKNLLADMDKKDFDFTKLPIELIPDGVTMISGSRFYRDGSKDPALVETVNYNNLTKEAALTHAFGFIKNTINKEELKPENELARVMLEIASPLPTLDSEFLRSSFALKLLDMKGLVLIQGAEDFKLMSKVLKNPELLTNFTGPHKAAFDRFRRLAEEIRNAEIKGETITRQIGTTGLTVTLKMTAEIVSGAYTKCANATFTAVEKGEIVVTKDSNSKTIAIFKETNEVIDAKQDKIFQSIALTGLSTKSSHKPEEPKTPDKPKEPDQPKNGKVSAVGGGENPKQGIAPQIGEVKIDSAGKTAKVSTGPGSAGVGSGSNNKNQNTAL